jgi:hypothetical protein
MIKPASFKIKAARSQSGFRCFSHSGQAGSLAAAGRCRLAAGWLLLTAAGWLAAGWLAPAWLPAGWLLAGWLTAGWLAGAWLLAAGCCWLAAGWLAAGWLAAPACCCLAAGGWLLW